MCVSFCVYIREGLIGVLEVMLNGICRGGLDVRHVGPTVNNLHGNKRMHLEFRNCLATETKADCIYLMKQIEWID